MSPNRRMLQSQTNGEETATVIDETIEQSILRIITDIIKILQPSTYPDESQKVGS